MNAEMIIYIYTMNHSFRSVLLAAKHPPPKSPNWALAAKAPEADELNVLVC